MASLTVNSNQPANTFEKKIVLKEDLIKKIQSIRPLSFDPIGMETLRNYELILNTKCYSSKPPSQEVSRKLFNLLNLFDTAIQAYNAGKDREPVVKAVRDLETLYEEIRTSISK